MESNVIWDSAFAWPKSLRDDIVEIKKKEDEWCDYNNNNVINKIYNNSQS